MTNLQNNLAELEELLIRRKHGKHDQKSHGRRGSNTSYSRLSPDGKTFNLSRADVRIGRETILPDGTTIYADPGSTMGITKFTRYDDKGKVIQKGRFTKQAASIKIPMKTK